MRIALTGGMGCGKSTVASLFAAEGWNRIDADDVVKSRILTDSEVVSMLVQRWGSGILNEAGAVNRAEVAQRVFARDEERLWLESIIHPRVRSYWMAVSSDRQAHWVVEIPLLFEKGLEKEFDSVVCVGASYTTQLARLENRGVSREQASQRISKQYPLLQKVNLSQFVIWNDGDQDFLLNQVRRCIGELKPLNF